MGRLRTLDDMPVAGKLVVLRADLNVPVKDGVVGDRTRIERVVPTIRELLDQARRWSFCPISAGPRARWCATCRWSRWCRRWPRNWGAASSSCLPTGATGRPGGRPKNCCPARCWCSRTPDSTPARKATIPRSPASLAQLGDIFVNDAFSAAHRAHASTEGIAHHLPSVAGRAMQAELDALKTALEHPTRPLVAVIGGAKISTKLDLLGTFTRYADVLVIGGAMANTLLKAQGHDVGRSLIEADRIEDARRILDEAQAAGRRIVLPVDAVVASELKAGVDSRTVKVTEVGENDMILDIGPSTVADVNASFDAAATLIWNGPLGSLRGRALRPRHGAGGAPCREAHRRGQADVGGRRRRHRGGPQPRRRGRRILLCLDRRRRVPGVAGRQAAAGCKGPGKPRASRHERGEVMSERLEDIAHAMTAEGKGILAADESTGTIKKRFDSIGVESTPVLRRDYREMMFSASEAMRNHISGVILFDETIQQTASDGRPMAELIRASGAIPGIKVDKGAKDMAFHPGKR
jgi:phosphoglycerate kinase